MNKIPENDLNELNPRIAYVNIGIRNPMKLKLYPLSLKDESDLMSLVKEGLEGLAGLGKAETDTLEIIDFVAFLIEFIVSNLSQVLSKSIDNFSDAILDEIDNDQAVEIATVFLGQNFGGITKKVPRLLGLEEGDLSLLWRRLLQSSPNIPNSVLNTFSDSVTEKEDLPEDN